MAHSAKQLQERIQKLAKTAIQGSLSKTTRTCGNKKCACHSDPAKRHGPNLYLTFKTAEGKSSSLYIPPEYEKTIRRTMQAWVQLRKTLIVFSEKNRNQLQKEMRRRPKKVKK